MALVVHDNFTYKGRPLKRGDVLFGEDADAVARHPVYARKCSAASDEPFLHLKPGNGKARK